MQIEQTAGSPWLIQVIVLVAIIGFFFLGMIARSFYDDHFLDKKQFIAGGIIVFMTFALPISQVVYDSIQEAVTIFAMLSACIPPFTFGVSAKDQIAKIIKSQHNDAAADASPAAA